MQEINKRPRQLQLYLALCLILTSFLACSAESRQSSQSTSDSLRSEVVNMPRSCRLVFAGDIMAHGPQIQAAHTRGDSYDFSRSFDSLALYIGSADLAIGNLETTFGGKPYTGYPTFSTPTAMAVALQRVGFDVLTTSNNHSADRSALGIVRTLDVLDSLGIKHTGSYRHIEDRASQSPLILEIKGLKLAIMAYTYGTNGIKVPSPQWVDPIDTTLMRRDIRLADSLGVDCKIVQIHWGQEYERRPNAEQRTMARWLSDAGVDVIIGSHPHVVQESEWLHSPQKDKRSFVIYSMGNFISNQRSPVATRGGMLLGLDISLEEQDRAIRIVPSYRYVFVNKQSSRGEGVYRLFSVELDEEYIPSALPPKETKELQAFRHYYRQIPLVQP